MGSSWAAPAMLDGDGGEQHLLEEEHLGHAAEQRQRQAAGGGDQPRRARPRAPGVEGEQFGFGGLFVAFDNMRMVY